MSRFKSLLLLLVLAAQVPLASATVTYVVGTCQKAIYTSITQALQATPPPNVVKICPGTYNEQLVITFPVTLEGISDGTSTGATIAVPSGGLVLNDGTVAVQVWVENAGGEVNLSNLTVDGTGNNVTNGYIVGVMYSNSPGTMNHVTLQNQNATGYGLGVGVWVEGGAANPSVTLENSNLQAFDYVGIYSGINSTTSELTETIKGNFLAGGANSGGMFLWGGITASVSDNFVSGGNVGIGLSSGAGAVSENTIVGALSGINDAVEGISVTSNAIYNTGGSGWGITVNTGDNRSSGAAAPIAGNIIVQSGTAIDFNCVATNNVHSNTILGATNGLTEVPTGMLSTNTYYNVGTVSSSGGC